MNMMKFSHLRSVFAQERNLPWFCALVAALVAAWVNYQARGVINNDGILYVEVARLFAADSWREGVATYNWPFYPLLIMAVHKISGLGLQISANLLTVLFFAATAMGMATLIRELGGSCRTMVAGLVLLIATPYLVGDILPMVAREHGYWASFIWGVVYFLRFSEQPSWRNAVLWGLLAIICVLFRIEGLTYLVAVPLVLLADMSIAWMRRLQNFAKANAVLIALGAGLMTVLLAHPTLHLSDLGRLSDPLMIAELVYQQVTTGLADRAEVIGQQAFGRFLDDYGMPVLLLGMLYILIAKAFTVGGVLQSSLAVIFWKNIKNLLHANHFRFLVWLLILSLVNAAVILVKGFILPKRILSPLGLVVIILAAFAVTAWLEKIRNQRESGIGYRKWFAIVLATILLAQIVMTLKPQVKEKSYEKDAIVWLLSNSPSGSRIYYETKRMRFYAGQPMLPQREWATIQQSRWQQALVAGAYEGDDSIELMLKDFEHGSHYDYFVLTSKKSKMEHEAMLVRHFGEPLKIFEGQRGNRILVFAQPK